MNESAAIAALVSLGIDPGLAAAMVAHWAAEKLAKRSAVFGLLLPRPQAQLLRQKVAATKEQVIKKVLPIAAAFQALQSYGIPDATAQALTAAWDAQANKQVDQP